MYFLIYSSLASEDIAESDLKEIILTSEGNNGQDGITGMLIFYDGTFIQMLEGEKDRVLKSYKKIQDDSRHSSLIKLFEGQTDKRYFPDWKMALKVVERDDFDKIKAFQPLEDGKQLLAEIDDRHLGLQMLRFFYDQKHPF